MEKRLITLGFMVYITAMFVLMSPGGFADISITAEFLWFIIPAMISQLIFFSVKLVRMGVGPETWKKHARKAWFVGNSLEMLTLHKMAVWAFIDNDFWARFIVTLFTIGIMAFTFAHLLVMHRRHGIE